MININQLNKELYKPKEVCQLLGVSLRTVQNMTQDGRLDVVWSKTGRRYIPKQSLIEHLRSIGYLVEQDERMDVIYARVSTHKQKARGDLQRQIEQIQSFAISKNPKNLKTITDVGSGLNDSRAGLLNLIKLIQDDQVDRVFINYKDRLTRFGFNYIQAICEHHQTKIIIVSDEVMDKSLSEELAEDIISIIHSFSGKMYGLRKTIKDSIQDE